MRAARLGGVRPQRRRPEPRRRARPWVAVAAVVVLTGAGLLLGACGGDDGEGTDAAADEPGRGDRAEGAATDPEVVRSEVEDLLDSYDRVVNQVIEEPGVVADRDDPLVQEYLSLYEPGSDFAEGALDAWESDAEEGMSTRPFDDEHPATRTRLDGEIVVESSDELRVPFCVEQRQSTYRGDQLVQGVPLLERQGEITAVRVDDEWRLRRREVFGDRSGCRQPGEGEGEVEGEGGGDGGGEGEGEGS